MFIHVLGILYSFIDNEKIKFNAKNYHIFQINGVHVNEVCVLLYASLAPNLHSDIFSKSVRGDDNMKSSVVHRCQGGNGSSLQINKLCGTFHSVWQVF